MYSKKKHKKLYMEISIIISINIMKTIFHEKIFMIATVNTLKSIIKINYNMIDLGLSHLMKLEIL